ncbi:MAG: MFS transporter [Provencibacterium sp.]|jgi:GPH family glycoside/pentoside/hexuronide:cation symporter|nr:MFS transporter [Provencibacterium sp.]
MRPFGIRDQVGYMFGDMGGSFVYIYVDAYFMTFCTYALGIHPFFMGTLFLCIRLLEACYAPIVGSIPDRRALGHSGDKFKPYIKAAMLPLALAGICCFSGSAGWNPAFKHLWVIFCYVFYGLAYSFAAIPYGSMASVISGSPEDRTKLSRARSIGGSLVNFGALSLVPLAVFDEGNEVRGRMFLLLAVIFGACSLVSYQILLRNTEERIRRPRSEQPFRLGRVVGEALRNRPLIGAMTATIGSLILLTGQAQFGAYFYKEYYGAPRMLSVVNLATLPITALLFLIVPRLSARLGKRNLLLGAGGMSLAVSLFLFLVPLSNVWHFFMLNLLAALGNNVFSMLVWALVCDCIDYQEITTGERSDGSIYSIFAFARKLGATAASALASYGLGWIGFVSGAAQQTPEVARNIRMLYTAIPLVASLLIVAGIGLVYNLSQADTERISQELEKRHEGRVAG